MNNPQQFFDDEIAPRWPDWEPTAQQANDWCKLIAPYRKQDVDTAITKLAYECEFKKPSLKVMKRLLKDCFSGASEYKKEIYIIEQNTGQRTTVVLMSKQPFTDDILIESATNEATKIKELYGGEWVAYTNITWAEAMKISAGIKEGR